MSDLVQTPGNVLLVSGKPVSPNGIAGQVITAGMPVFEYSEDNNRLYKSSSGSLIAALCSGIALVGSSPGQPCVVQRTGIINLGATLRQGEIYGVSNDAGKICPTSDYVSDQIAIILGIALDSSRLQLNIQAPGVLLEA